MSDELNVVDSVQVRVYPGDDVPFWLSVDTTDDVSGIPVENWTVVLGLVKGAVPLGNTLLNATIQLYMTWNAIESRFEVILPRSSSLTMAPGSWTAGIWRMNNNAVRLLIRLKIMVEATVQVTTTSTTTTTTTTTP